MPEYCVTFVSGPDEADTPDVFHVHVDASTDIVALALAYQAAAHGNISLALATGVLVSTVLPVPALALGAYEELRAMHHNGAPATTWAPPGGPGAPMH